MQFGKLDFYAKTKEIYQKYRHNNLRESQHPYAATSIEDIVLAKDPEEIDHHAQQDRSE